MNLIIFNMEMNENSKALSHCIDWVNNISKYCENIFVISLKTYNYTVNNNVIVYGINKTNKFLTTLKIFSILKKIHTKNKIDGYFIHMSPNFIPIIFPFAKYYKIKTAMWYTHRSLPLLLKIGKYTVNRFFSVSKESFLLKTKKVQFTGHGIDTNKFLLKPNYNTLIKNIIIVGRISKVKNTLNIIKTLIKLNNQNINAYFIGETLTKKDILYLDDIKYFIKNNSTKTKIIFSGHLNKNALLNQYQNSDLAINLGDGGLDKAIIEPMSMGIPIITSNKSAKELFTHLNNHGVYLINKEDLHTQLLYLIENGLIYSPEKLREEIIKNHSITNLAKKITNYFLAFPIK